MEDRATPRDRSIERGAIAQITGDAFHLQFPELACRTAQRTNRVAALSQKTSDMPAEKSASAGDKGGFQRESLVAVAQRRPRGTCSTRNLPVSGRYMSSRSAALAFRKADKARTGNVLR